MRGDTGDGLPMRIHRVDHLRDLLAGIEAARKDFMEGAVPHREIVLHELATAETSIQRILFIVEGST